MAAFAPLRAAPPPGLLEHAVESWLGERDHWAFTQRAIEYGNGAPRERLERFDPSKPGRGRWQLLAIDGRLPTLEQRLAWEKRRFKKTPRRFDAPLGDYFDFEHAKVLGEHAQEVRYDVRLRTDRNWLFPTDKVEVTVTVNRNTRAIEHRSAHVREPFKVFLGIARITNGEVDLDFLGFDPRAGSPAAAQPAGDARMSVSTFGERVDFTWSDFKRVAPARPPAETASDGAREP